jgi:hypothetical protein
VLEIDDTFNDEFSEVKILHPRDLAYGNENKIPHLKEIAARDGKRPRDYAIGFTAVARIGGRGDDWAAYWLRTHENGTSCLRRGDKVPRVLAEQMFPYFPAAGFEYRD